MNTSLYSAKSFLIFLLVNIVTCNIFIMAEGTKEIRPTATDDGYLILDGGWSQFAFYNCPEATRLQVRISNVGEKIYFGFNQQEGDVKFRIKDPLGNIVYGEATVPTSGNGFIPSHAKAVAGPSAIVGAAGYDALSITASVVGDYYIEFANPNSRREFNLFDITVASAANEPIKGRVWSKAWMFSTRSFSARFEGKLFIYADDGIVTSLDFNGMQPYVFVLSANASGTQNTGNTVLDRQSTKGNQTYPQYKIFLNDPDPLYFKNGVYGKLNGQTIITGCGLDRCINVFVDKAGSVEILLDLQEPAGFQPGTKDRILSAVVVEGKNCVKWDTKDGLGNLVPGNSNIAIEVNYFNGLTHLPLYDVEGQNKGYIVELVRPMPNDPAQTKPRLFWDDSKIQAPNAVKENLTGCTNPSGCHTWNWAGSDNVSTDYGNTNTINTWWYAQIIHASADLPITDVLVDANTTKTPEQGNDTSFCATSNNIPLSGAITGSPGGTWSGGKGSFSDPKDFKAKYFPSDVDRNNGKVKLYLTSDAVQDCPPETDSLVINLIAPPTATASDISVCENINTVTLAGNITKAKGGEWIGGLGAFVPDRQTLNAVYTPTTVEKKSFVSLKLSTTGNGLCEAVSVPIAINFTKGPTSYAGKDTSLCGKNPVMQLNGKISKSATAIWKGGLGTFNPARTTPNANYTPTQAEINNGSITLSLETTDNANCNASTDQIVISFTPLPKVDAGSDRSICENSAVNLTGIVNGGSGTWVGAGSFSPNNNDLSAVYSPTPAEIAAKKSKLFLKSVIPGCPIVTDSMEISFTPSPKIDAGADIILCSNNAVASLNATVTGATGVVWSSLGNGKFVPNEKVPNPTYILSPEELKLNITSLTATTTGNGGCNPVKDNLAIQIVPAPTANAGADQNICKNNPLIKLSGKATNNPGQRNWSGGNGNFLSETTMDTVSYMPSSSELAAGSVTLNYTASKSPTSKNSCIPVTDQVIITFTAAPLAEAGPTQNICTNNTVVKLSGSFIGAASGKWMGGQGSFLPSNTSLDATYTPTSVEVSKGSFTLFLRSEVQGNCNPVSDSVTVKLTPSPVINAGNDISVCSNNAVINLDGKITAVSTGGKWSGGNGIFSGNNTQPNAKYTPTAQEIAAGSLNLTFTSTGNGNCNEVSDNVVIKFTPSPASIPGSDITVCADKPMAQLNGAISIAQGGVWSGGNGNFTPNPTTLKAIYHPTMAEINAGSVSLLLTTTNNNNCNPVAATTMVLIIPAPTVNAGADQTACGNITSMALNGKVTTATGGTWTTSGTGSFSPNPNILNASYLPSQEDKAKGFITFTLTTTGNGFCNAVTDDMKLTFSPIPTVSAGPDKTVCTNDFPVKLNGSGPPSNWKSGQGSFTPANNVLNAGYTPSAAEVSSGKVVLILATIGTANCPAVSDTVAIAINKGPEVNAGQSRIICGNTASLTLTGTVNSPFMGIWSTTGTGSFSPNPNALDATYKFSSTDKSIGFVDLILTSVNNNLCGSDTNLIRINLTPTPKADAGPDEKICADAKDIALKGEIVQAVSATWSSNGTGLFLPSVNDLNAVYKPTAADVSTGKVILVLTTKSDGICNSVNDSKTLTITPAPKVEAGNSIIVCADTAYIQLNGIVQVATGGKWTTSGNGTFSPDAFALKGKYYLSKEDKTAGKIYIRLTSEGNGTCFSVKDSLMIDITPAPTVEAGTDQQVCSDNAPVNLKATFTVASGVNWTTTGSGTFTSGSNAQTVYLPSTADIANGLVTLMVKSTGTGSCKAVKDKLNVSIAPAPAVNAGSDQKVCADVKGIQLSGQLKNVSKARWSSNGTGTFIPHDSLLNASYVPSAQDIVKQTVILTLTTPAGFGCLKTSDNVTIDITPSPIVSAGSDQVVCADTLGVALGGVVKNATGGKWTTNGSGKFFPGNASLISKYVPSQNDILNGNVTLNLTSAGNGTCNAVTDELTVKITPAPTIKAGADTIVCSNTKIINLSGKATTASGGYWMSSGTGNFSPDSLSLQTGYLLSEADRSVGTVYLTLTSKGNGSCKAVSGTKKLTINPIAIVNAGVNQIVCADVNSIDLKGNVKISTGSIWSSTGSGTFTPSSTLLNSSYLISTQDRASGKVKIILSSTDNGICPAVNDTLDLTITPAPTISAGADISICTTINSIDLTGTSTVATGGTWTSSGSGSFISSSSSLKPTYKLSIGDKSLTKIKFKVVSTGQGSCNKVEDEMEVTLIAPPTANAGPDAKICGNTEFYKLSGNTTNSFNHSWSSSGNGNFTSGKENLRTDYAPSASDINRGQVTFTLSVPSNGACPAVSDQVLLTIIPAPTIDAGPDFTVCPNVTSIELDPVITGATGVYWSSKISEFSSNQQHLSYIPTDADTTAGNIEFIVYTTGSDICNMAMDTVTVTFNKIPLISAGPNETVCLTSFPIKLKGKGAAGIWSNYNGTLVGGATSLSASYTPSAGEISANKSMLILTSAPSGTCAPSKDTVTFQFIPGPTVNAGVDNEVCETSTSIPLNGNVTLAGPGVWATSGTGTFAGNNYMPSAEDKIGNSVILTLTSSPYLSCKEVKDEVAYTFAKTPSVGAGLDQILCSDASKVTVNGTADNTKGTSWKALPSGTSFGIANQLNNDYQLSASDISTGKIQIVLIGQGGGICADDSDTLSVAVLKQITADIGNDEIICSNKGEIALKAVVTVAGGVEWKSSGTGYFSPDINALNPSYIPSPSDTAAKSITISVSTIENMNCPAGNDEKQITFTPEPVISAGSDEEICAEVKTLTVKGKVKNAGGVIWSTPGSGGFTDKNLLSTVYTLGDEDKARGGLILTVKSLNTGVCPQVTDNLYVRILPIPGAIVNAGFDQTACANGSTVQLDGYVKGAGGGIWGTKGTGEFLPNKTALNALYKPSPKDTADKVVRVFLTTTDNGVCSAVSDTMSLSFIPAPVVVTGTPKTVCADTTYIQLNGAIAHTTQAIWSSSGSGTFVVSPNDLNGKYFLSEGDRTKGSISFTLTSTDNNVCEAATNTVKHTLESQPKIDAGPDDSMCANSGKIPLKGIVSVSKGLFWSTSGTGDFLPDEQSSDAEYVPSQNDIEAGTVIIKVQSTFNKLCKPVTDTKIISILPAPVVNAGTDQTICADINEVHLQGQSSSAGSAQWSTSGSGTFLPSATDLNPTYILSQEDLNQSKVTLTLITGASYNCDKISDEVIINILPRPKANPMGTVICDLTQGAELKGIIENADAGTWASSGSGTFSPSAVFTTGTAIIYKPSSADITAGEVTLSLTTTGKGVCKPVVENTILKIVPPPLVDAGADKIICTESTSTLTPKSDKDLRYGWKKAGDASFTMSYDYAVTPKQYTQYVLEGIDSRGCQQMDTVGIYTISPPQLNLDAHFCYTYNLLVDSKPFNIPLVNGDFQWNKNGRNIIGENKSVIIPDNSGNYIITYSYGNCIVDDSTTITDAPLFATTDSFGCVGDSTSLEASSMTNLKYEWYYKNNKIKTGNPVKVWTIIDTNFYKVKATESKYQCSSTDFVRVIGLSKPIIDLPGLTACSQDTIILLGKPSNIKNLDSLKMTYVWTKDKKEIGGNNDYLKITQSGFYGLKVTAEVCTGMDTATIKFNPLPYALPLHETEFCEERDKFIVLDAGPEPALKYFWEQSGHNKRKDTVRTGGTYFVTLTNQYNCLYRDSIKVKSLCPPKIFVPNAFKPGETNEPFFKVFGTDFKNFKIMVFSRWGEIIYYSEDRNEIWDGKYKGEIMPIGVYPYLITYEGEAKDSKKPYKMEGTITIVR